MTDHATPNLPSRDFDAFYAVCKATGLPETSTGQRRLHARATEP